MHNRLFATIDLYYMIRPFVMQTQNERCEIHKQRKLMQWWVSQSVFMLSKSFAKGLFAEEEVLKGEGEEKIVGRIFNHLPPRYTLRDMHKFVGLGKSMHAFLQRPCC